MSNPSTYENHWGNSMITGIPFVLKNKYASMAEASKSMINPPTNHGFMYDFTYELEVLKRCEAAELLEKKLQGDAKLEAEKETMKTKMAEDPAQPEPSHCVPQITILEPKRSEASPASESGLTTKDSNAIVDRSLIEDFEATGPRDDPFVAAELGTINDLEELRDVLASMKTSLNVQTNNKETIATKSDKFSSLKSLCFPQLSVDESTSAALGSIPTSSSQPNLFTLPPKTPSFESLHSNTSQSNPSATPAKEGAGLKKCFDEVEENKEAAVESSLSAALLAHPRSSSDSDSQKGSTVHVEQLPSVDPPKANSNCSDGTEEDFGDSPVVSHLTKMGFERARVLTLLDAGNKTENEETLISQLCNWVELEEKGFARGVGQAAVLFSPHDLNKAIEFAVMMTELIEMGFPLDATGEALRVSKMNKEAAVMRLLDLNCSSVSPSTSTRDSHWYNYSLDNTPRHPNGRKSKKKDQKKSHVSHSYLHARH